MTSEPAPGKPARSACPYCGQRLSVGVGQFLPTKFRRGPVRIHCPACRGWARLASSSQAMAGLGFVLGLAGGAIAGARVAAINYSELSMLFVLGLAVAGAFLLSFLVGTAFLRFDPDGDPPSRAAPRERRGKRSRSRK